MPRVEITGDYGEIKLGGELVPGIYQGMSISGDVNIKEEEAPGASKKYKQALGWEDMTVSLSLILQNDDQSTPYEKLKKLTALFRKTDKAAKPEVYRIVNQHTAAYGLDRVLIKSIRSDDPPSADYIKVSIEMVEWESPMVKIEARAVQGPVMGRTDGMPDGTGGVTSPGSSEVEGWQQRPTDDPYKDTIEVPDDD